MPKPRRTARLHLLLIAAATLAVVGTAALPSRSSRGDAPPAKPKPQAAPVRDGETYYTQKVLPILTARCLTCHSGADGSGGLDMTSRAAILKGGTTGPAVSLSKPEDSLVLRYISYHDTHKMPPQGKIPQAEIDILTRWVSLGMPFAGDKASVGGAAKPTGNPLTQVNATTKNWWAFRKVARPAVPHVKNPAWVRTPLDAFVLARLEKAHLTPAAPASRLALIRRVTYDLTGLPPTQAEVQAFLADKSPTAYEKVVDRLLASPHYGERWGRHWLDLVHWAETNSFERDNPKPFVWRYRDWVIDAFNRDMPYDQFLREQLAGDEIDHPTADSITATGYYRLVQWDDEPADPEQAQYDEIDDWVATTSQTMLGITVNCARCHDHKIDPIPQKDYYRMAAVFQGVKRYGARGESPDTNSLTVIATDDDRKRFAGEETMWRGKLDAATAPLATIEAKVEKDLSPVEKEEWGDERKRSEIISKRIGKSVSDADLATYKAKYAERDELRRNPPAALARALSVKETDKPLAPFTLMQRGNPHAPGDIVTPGFPSVLSPPEPTITPRHGGKTTGRRLALADWITSPTNPLTARVMANRVFQYHFGRGIVRSSSNFGRLGDLPTHPELLDYLASELVRDKWQLKPLHRLIVLSSAYRMSSQGNPVALTKDPANDLLWRFDMRRLEAEEVRDSILAADETLNPQMFGPSVYPTIPDEVLAGQSVPGSGWPRSKGDQASRRSVYVHIKRSLALPILAAFDASDTDFTCPVRFATTQPTQALSLMNSRFLNDEAGHLADLLKRKGGTDPRKQVALGLWQVTQRPPTQKEIDRGVRFLTVMGKEPGISSDESLRRFCVVLLNLNEFVYLD